jgi:hypothetical protein
MSSATKLVANKAAAALRKAAFTLFNSKSALGAYLRRQRARLSAPKAITATAHKLARLVYAMLTHEPPMSMSARSIMKNAIVQGLCKPSKEKLRNWGLNWSPYKE